MPAGIEAARFVAINADVSRLFGREALWRRIPLAHLVLNFRDLAPPSPRGVLANATPRRFCAILSEARTRERIRTGVIIDRFQKHFMGELDLTPTQIRVGEVRLV